MSFLIRRPLTALALAVSIAPLAPFVPAAHAAETGKAAATAHEVVIKRDEYGVPHIYANSVYRLFYGYGYAVAQDRLFQMEMAKRSTQGTVAEVLGDKFVKFDQATRGNYWPASIEKQIAALPQRERDILDGYAAGMNAYLAHVREQPGTLMPKQFNDFGFAPSTWSAFDVAMVFVGTMANRFSDSTSEVDNLALLTALTDRYGETRAMDLFNQLKWLVNPNARTTIAASERSYAVKVGSQQSDGALAYALPRYDAAPPMADRLARSDDGLLLALDPAANRETVLAQYAQSGANGPAGFPTTSNMWIIGKERARGAKAIMLNGPQFGWFAPAYTYGVGLHGAGFDIVGNTPFAYPCMLFGHNGRISWGSTAGFGDDVDMYAERIDPARPDFYWHDGRWVQMQKRTEIIHVKDGAPVVLDVYRTVHGNVMQRDDAKHTAYAKARAWDGLEVQSLLAWTHQAQARDWKSWTSQAARQALTINWYYADRDGNIGYAHTGAYPHRRDGHDPRLPVPGTGEWDWRGLLPFSTNPQIYNPHSGYIANWNNSPEKGYPASDLFAFLWGTADRVDEISKRIDAHPTLDSDDVWQILKDTSRADLNVRHFLPFIERATASLPADDPRRRIADTLRQWNGLNDDPKDSGRYAQPGSAIMSAWLGSMLTRTVAKAVPAPFDKWYMTSGYETTQDGPTGSMNLSTGSKILYEALLGERSGVPQRVDLFAGEQPDDVVRAALGDVWTKLSEQQGKDIAAWRTPAVALTFRANNFFGVPQAGASEAIRVPEYQNRGTENDLIVFGSSAARGKVQAFDVVAPGESGFIAPDGTRSPHYDDQLALYTGFGRKPLWLDDADVALHARQVAKLKVEESR
ncbi:penicillin amidase [Caballeronia arationis]|jgi:penicillin amidase|uniref:Acyl-homoserine lactone (AHL) acylase PvdQ n=1 Tax=Caballeronia arationis TaxID=1777142 RepID=A0A7Z7N6X5_9BURK|nr:penicillin acylase family protein [Caballeronia arationis]SAL02167.1 penicillin amidase [Caballeronia arationis]SOE89320.1 Acyl-homoserine lactone (AHL) acylase PvdQ [Caballeronia arationis]